jgi:hypothetical protein
MATLTVLAGAADRFPVFSLCRYCGDELARFREPLEVCAKCENSPLCDGCGHPEPDELALQLRRVWPVVGALSSASFAEADPDPPRTPLRVLRKG